MKKILLILIAYIPFQLALNLAPDIDLASGRVLILIIFALWVLISLARKRLEIPAHPITYLILLILTLSCLSLTQGVFLGRGLRKILVLASCFPLYFLVAGVFSVKKIKTVVKVLIFSGLVLAIIGLVQFFSQFLFGIKPVYQFWARFVAPIFLGKTFTAAILANPSWLVNVGGKTFLRATSLFPDPHIFSFYLGLIIPLMFALLLYPKKHKRALHVMPLLVTFGLLLTAQFLTFSRGGYLGMFVALPFMVFVLWRMLGLKTKVLITVFALVSIVLVFILGWPIINRAVSIFNFKEPSIFGRLLIWRETLDTIRDHPFLGVGIGSYSGFVNPAASYRAPIYAHNTYLDITVEMGIFALIAWLGIFIVALRGLWKIVGAWGATPSIRARHGAPLQILSVGLMGSLVWFSIHALVDTPIFSPRVLPMLMIILGLSVVIIETNKKLVC